jgi:FkbM family methyltransferase
MKLKNIINKALASTGYQICKSKPGRNSLTGAMNNLAKIWSPDVIFDVGAAVGSWTKECQKIFPKAKYVLIEPLQEFFATLEKIKANDKNITVVHSAAAANSGPVIFNVHEDLFGSSLKKEVEGEKINGRQREIAAKTLDQIEKELCLKEKYFIKLDVQNAELDVLSGAQNVLKNTECLLLEVSLFKSFLNGQTLAEVTAKLNDLGFVAYDIFGHLYRPYDNALCQIDVIFVKKDGIFQKFQGYANEEQRAAQNEKFKKMLRKESKKYV